jgi:ABC-type dipeptide/oligopeptide/nickel transport system permease subunit
MAAFDHLWVQNLSVFAGYALLGWALRHVAGTERWKAAWKRLRSDRTGMGALVVICGFLLVGTLESFSVPEATGSRTLLQLALAGVAQEKGYSAPMAETTLSVSNPTPLVGRHLLGTDALGRDTLVQTLRATRSALWIGGLTARLIRGETLRQVERPYVAAARAMGQSDFKILTAHLLPNVMHLVLIKAVLGFSGLVLAEAVLSYLGVGSPVGTASWGAMIDASRSELSREPFVWWNISSAACALFLLVLALNLFGDALRRAFDPKHG